MTDELAFCARVVAYSDSYDEIAIPEHVLDDLHASVSGDEDLKMAQYLIDEPTSSPLRDAGITDGSMILAREGDVLLIYVRYFLEKSLAPKQVDRLMDFTRGQLSDGAGEGFMQDLWGVHQIRLEVDADSIRLAIP